MPRLALRPRAAIGARPTGVCKRGRAPGRGASCEPVRICPMSIASPLEPAARPRGVDRARGPAHPAARPGAGAAGPGRAGLGRRRRAGDRDGAGAAAQPRRHRDQPRPDRQPRVGRGGGPALRVRAGRRRRPAARAAAGRPHLAALPAPHRRPAGARHRRHGLARHGRPGQQLRDQGGRARRAAPRRAGDRGAGGPAEEPTPAIGMPARPPCSGSSTTSARTWSASSAPMSSI